MRRRCKILQGATADPGLIFHWLFPAMISKEMRWLTVYMALSRVRSLEQFRPIGLKDTVKSLMMDLRVGCSAASHCCSMRRPQRRMSLPTQRCRSLDGDDGVATEHCVVELCVLILPVVPPRQLVLSAVPATTRQPRIYAHTVNTRTVLNTLHI